MVARCFRNDEAGYMKWCADHPHGFVVNIEQKLRPTYIVLHRVNCTTIDPAAPKSPGGFTGPHYAKCCADTTEELRVALPHPFSKICRRCKPGESPEAGFVGGES